MEFKKIQFWFLKLPLIILAISFLLYILQTYGLTFSASGTNISDFGCLFLGRTISCSAALLAAQISQPVFGAILLYALATLGYYLILKRKNRKSGD